MSTVSVLTPVTVAPPRSASQRIFVALLGVLAVLLPALVAGGQIGRAGSDLEFARLQQGLAVAANPEQRATLAARTLYAVTAPDVALQDAPPTATTLARARLAVVVATLIVSGLLYLLLSACRGGLTAMFACLAFAGLPPVMDEGFVLRPEPVAAAFALLGTLTLAAFVFAMLVRLRRGTVRRVVLLTALMPMVGAAFGIAAASLSTASVFLLVPAAVVTLAWAVQVWTWVRLLRRQRLARNLLAPLGQRAWPWFGLAALGMAATSAVLYVLAGHGVEVAVPSASAFGLLPASGVRAVLVAVLIGIGALRLLLEGGAQLSALRLHPSLVVLLFVALALMQHAMVGAGTSAFIPACAAAMLVGEGITTALALLAGSILARARRQT